MLGAVHDEVLAGHVHGHLRTFADKCVEQRLLQVHQERVAVFVVFELFGSVVTDAAAEQLVLPHAGLLQLVEDVAQRRLPDSPHASRRQLHPPPLSLDVARFLEHLCHAPQLVERLPGIVAQELLGQRPIDVVGPEASALQLSLEPIHLLQSLHEPHRLAHAQGVVAEERVALAQLRGRHHRLHETGKPRQLEPQRVVLQQRVHHLTQLFAGLGAEALQQ